MLFNQLTGHCKISYVIPHRNKGVDLFVVFNGGLCLEIRRDSSIRKKKSLITSMHAHTHTHTSMHACTCTYTYINAYIYIYIYIYSINMTYRGVEICFARSCKHQQNPVALYPVSFLFFSCFFSCFSCVYTNRIYGHRIM